MKVLIYFIVILPILSYHRNHMDPKDQTIQQLQSEVDRLQNDLSALKYNFNEQKHYTRELEERVQRLRSDIIRMTVQRNESETKIQNLEDEIRNLTEENSSNSPVIVKKCWKNLKPRGKFKRKAKYKDVLDKSVKCITECKRAKVTLSLGEDDINLKWTDQEMSTHREQLGITLPTSDQNSESSADEANTENNEPNSNRNYEVFDSECRFTKRHKRTIITTMDQHRVSHRAYHALRKAGKENWPSINVIKKEKKHMSTKLPFALDEEVRINFKR